MTQKEKIEILEKENSRLQTEIDSLKSSSTNVNQKYKELAELKEKWENEISEMNKLRKKYKTLKKKGKHRQKDLLFIIKCVIINRLLQRWRSGRTRMIRNHVMG